jgi:hypothetical protein
MVQVIRGRLLAFFWLSTKLQTTPGSCFMVLGLGSGLLWLWLRLLL